jgi:hypothetical protein
MKRKRHTEEQIIAMLNEHEAGMKRADCAASTESASGRTSRPEPQTNGPRQSRSGCSEKQHCPTCRSLHEHRPEDQTTDAIGTRLPETRFRGCS